MAKLEDKKEKKKEKKKKETKNYLRLGFISSFLIIEVNLERERERERERVLLVKNIYINELYNVIFLSKIIKITLF